MVSKKVGRKGLACSTPKSKPNKKRNASTSTPREHACICAASGKWCKDASAFFNGVGHPSGGFFKVKKSTRGKEDRMMAITQIQRHLNVSVEKWNKGTCVYVAKHHYRPDLLGIIQENARSGGITKFYTKKDMIRFKQDTLPADASKEGNHIIPPDQTKQNVADLKARLSLVPSIKMAGEISTGGASLSSGGPRVDPVTRSRVRRESRDVAAAVEMLEATGEDIYGAHEFDDCLDGEVVEEDECGSDDEDNDGNFAQRLATADDVLRDIPFRWNLWTDEYHSNHPEMSNRLFGRDWKLLKIIFKAKWPKLLFAGQDVANFRENFTKFESLLLTAHFFRSGYTYTVLTHTWGGTVKKISAAIKDSSPELSDLGQMLWDIPLDGKIIDAMIPERYPEELNPVGALVDGKVFMCQTTGTNNNARQHFYNHKTGGNGVMGLVWSLGCGLVVAASPLYLGRTSEKKGVFHYGSASKCITELQ